MKPKKTLCFMLAAVCAGVSLAACGGDSSAGGNTPPVEPDKPPVVEPDDKYEKAQSASAVSYDKAVGGNLSIPFRENDSKFFALRLDGVTVQGEHYIIDRANDLLTVKESYALSLDERSYAAGIVTDDGTLSFTLKVKNTMPIDFDGDTVRNFRSGDGDMSFTCTGATGVKSVTASGITVDPSYYSCGADGFVLKSDFLEKLSNITDIDVLFANNSNYRIRIFSDALLSADYDSVILYDETVSDWGLNSLCQDSKMMRIADDGIDGRSLEYTPSRGSYAMGEWARMFFTVKDPSYYDNLILWHSVDFDNNGEANYEISFDYRFKNATLDDKYTFYLLTDGSDGFFTAPTRAGIDFTLDSSDGEVHTFKKTVNGKLFKGLYFYADRYSDNSSLQIDNIKIVKKRIEQKNASFTSDTYFYKTSMTDDFVISGKIDESLDVDEIIMRAGESGSYETVKPENYTVSSGGLTFKKSFMDSRAGGHYIVFFSDGQSDDFTVASNVLFFSDYDDNCMIDDTKSELGLNALTNDSNNISIDSGIQNNSLIYAPGKSKYSMGPWANRVMTFKNPDKYDFTWYSLKVSSKKSYTVKFDYEVSDGADVTFKFVLLDRQGTAYVAPAEFGTVYDLDANETSFTLTFDGDEFCGMFIYVSDGYKGDATLAIDNFAVTEAI